MKQFFKQNKISLLYFVSLIASGYFLFPIWSLMLIAWSGLYFFIILKKYNSILTIKENNSWRFIVFIYPLLETLIKLAIEVNFIPYSWRTLNIIEHLMWSIAMFLILLPFTKKLFEKNGRLLSIAIIFGFVIVIGNLNELFEFLLRMLWNLNTQNLLAAYYTDTIIDLVNNMIGSGIGSIIAWVLLRKGRT